MYGYKCYIRNLTNAVSKHYKVTVIANNVLEAATMLEKKNILGPRSTDVELLSLGMSSEMVSSLNVEEVEVFE